MKVTKRLQTLFYSPSNPRGFTGNIRRFTSGKKDLSKTKTWFEAQDAWTKHRPVVRRFKRRRVISLGIHHILGLDLMDMTHLRKFNDGFAYILICIDLFSKKLAAIPLRRKTPADVIEGFNNILIEWGYGDERTLFPPIAFIWTDMGGEFGPKFSKHVKDQYDIKHYFAYNPDIKCSIVERVIQTLRRPLYRYFTHKNTQRYVEVLPELIKSYNNRYHSSIKMTPNQVSLENQDKVRENLYGTADMLTLLKTGGNQLASNRRLRTSQNIFKEGDLVRISKYKNIYEIQKGYKANYTNEVFRVVSRTPQKVDKAINTGQRIVYRLHDLSGERIAGTFYAEELSKIR